MPLGVVLLLPAAVHAQADDAQRIVIKAGGTEQRLFDTPYAAGVIDADELRAAGPMVNLSEAMSRVPGIVANNRHNYAQDLQINSRGFGARTAFGVRGLRLYTDGIPATGPDGQGQVTHFDLAGAQRVEVLRGPFSALYGSSSGGVISLVSAAPTGRRWLLGGDMGSDGLWQARAGVEAPFDGGFSLRASASHFAIDGFRPQSSARRTLGNVRLAWELPLDRVVVTLNSVNQPALDPLGLTRELFEQDPDKTIPNALPQSSPTQGYDTRKAARQDQAGVSWRHRFADAAVLQESRVAAYLGQRSVTQWQSIPFGVQTPATHPGGVIDFDRDYAGLDGRLLWRWSLPGDRGAQFVAGASVDRNAEDRRGFRNFTGTTNADRVLGVTGELRRNERNRVTTRDLYAQGEIEFAPRWHATLGVRHGHVDFRSKDLFLSNGDDSGGRDFRFTSPVAALQWHATPELNVYVSTGRGFESPTFNELSYRPDGLPGFNTDLDAQTSRQWETGLKWRVPSRGLSLDVAVFDVRTHDEIGVASSSGGRTTFRNVGRTHRHGAEVDLRWRIAEAWRAQLAASWLDASYRDTVTGTPIVAGNRVAGTLDAWGYAELAWRPARGAEVALEARGQGDVPANDANTDVAEGFGLLSLRTRYGFDLGPGRLDLLARVDNLADRRVVGSVIVNEANQRFFEPAPGRTWLLSARWSAAF